MMSAQRASAATPSDTGIGDFSAVAARLFEAAYCARDGNCEAAKAQIARAIALLRGEPAAIPTNRLLSGSGREIVRGGLAEAAADRIHRREPRRMDRHRGPRGGVEFEQKLLLPRLPPQLRNFRS